VGYTAARPHEIIGEDAMPTYEYLCKACAHEFEREQRISDPPVKTCPKCKAKQVKRLLSAPRFHLKGGGWYSDLYSKPGGKKGGEKKDGGTDSAPSKSSSDSAPAKGGSDSSPSTGGSDSSPSKGGGDSSPPKGDSGGSGSSSKAAA
jgi:putative FmdB family regulatory protein